jgi:hypothetical protein
MISPARLTCSTMALVALASALIAPRSSFAQGTLSTQGLGFPPGQLSTQANSMGGAIAEADPFSPINPAAIGLFGSPIIFFQAEPEYRELRIGGRMIRTSVSRFPVFIGSIPLGTKWAVSASASTLLDRTWETTTRDTQVVSGDMIPATVRNRSEGSIADLRLAAAYSLTSWLRIGVGGHAFSGRDVVSAVRAFDDTVRFVRDTQQTTLSFGGNAVSVGAQTLWPRIGVIGATYRRGGALRAYNGSNTVGRGSVPDHMGISLAYLGIAGTTIGVRAARDSWSRTKGLAPTLNVHEGWDIGTGIDVTGPRFGGSPIGLRAGSRWRTLPFSASASPVKERTLSGGFGLPMGGGRVELNMGLLRAARTSADGKENAWTISTGFAVRP